MQKKQPHLDADMCSCVTHPIERWMTTMKNKKIAKMFSSSMSSSECVQRPRVCSEEDWYQQHTERYKGASDSEMNEKSPVLYCSSCSIHLLHHNDSVFFLLLLCRFSCHRRYICEDWNMQDDEEKNRNREREPMPPRLAHPPCRCCIYDAKEVSFVFHTLHSLLPRRRQQQKHGWRRRRKRKNLASWKKYTIFFHMLPRAALCMLPLQIPN